MIAVESGGAAKPKAAFGRRLEDLGFRTVDGALIYREAAEQGYFVPADAQVWTQADLVNKCCGNWARCPAARELPPFQPITYSADVLVPVVDMGQRKHWEPTHVFLRWLMAFKNVAGALLVLLFGAIVSGVVKRD
jgi:hypothetical protein